MKLCLSSSNPHIFLNRDIKSYQDTISTLGILTLDDRFEFIKQLGNVFLVRPEILKSYITENSLGRIDVSLLKPYLALRSDWGQFEKGFNDATDETPDSFGTSGIKDRFGRLSVMMRDLEGSKVVDGLSSFTMPTMPTVPTISASFAGAFSIPARSSSGGV